MKWGGLIGFGVVVVACHQESAPPPTVPMEVEVPPMPTASGAIAQDPPPNAKKPAGEAGESGNLARTSETSDEDDRAYGLGSAPAPNPTGAPTPGFDKGAAAAALSSAPVRKCGGKGGPTGSGHVTLTFGNDGKVVSAVVDQGPFPGTPTGACVAGVFRSVHVPPFGGAPVRIGKSFVLQ